MRQLACEFYLPPLYYHGFMTYGARLQQAMDAKGVDRKTLASAIGVTPHAIGMVITGGGREERWLSRENNQKAAKFLKVDSHWLFTGDGEMAISGATQIGVAPADSKQSLPAALMDASDAAINTVADPLAILRMMHDRMPEHLRASALHAALLAMAPYMDVRTAPTTGQQPGADNPASMIDAPRIAPVAGKKQAS